LLGILYNMSYPLGMMLLPLIAVYIKNWRMLQLALSVPTVILILHIWYVTFHNKGLNLFSVNFMY